MRQRVLAILFAIGGTLLWACADRMPTSAGMTPGQGRLAMQLIDAPPEFDSIAAVNIFVVRVDARERIADSASAADSAVDGEGDMDDRENEHRDSSAWVTVASPNKTFNLLGLQGGDTAFLGASVVDTAHFRALRLVIDPSKSNVVLKDGTILTDSTSPSVDFLKRGRFGILVDLDNDADVRSMATTTITLDFRLGEGILLRGGPIEEDGLIIHAIVRGHCH